MKPSIANLAKLLIGRSAVSSQYVTTLNPEKAFVITDVKVERGMVSVKGERTPWLTENVVDVIMEENQDKISVGDIRATADKLKIVGTIKESNFEKLRDELLNGNMFPTGSTYIIQTTDPLEKNYAFVRFGKSWGVVDDIFYSSKLTDKDIARALIGISNVGMLLDKYPVKTDKFLDIIEDVSVFFLLSGIEYKSEDIFYYIKRKYVINDPDIRDLVKLILPETQDSVISKNMDMFDKVYKMALDIYKERKVTAKEISGMLVAEGMQLTLSKFAARIIKPTVWTIT